MLRGMAARSHGLGSSRLPGWVQWRVPVMDIDRSVSVPHGHYLNWGHLVITALSVSDSRIPTDTVQVGNPTRVRVVDCPSYAWDNSDQGARLEISAAFYGLYRADLDAAAHELMRSPLIAEWRKTGRLVRLVDGREFVAATDSAPEQVVPDEERWAVWQAAADQITGAELVFAAVLGDEYAAWVQR